jgi:chromosome segregation ATPase
MYNFMCHESFYQEWHPNINFIIGENGSGKSALLSGMLIGLGAKATATSRSKSATG